MHRRSREAEGSEGLEAVRGELAHARDELERSERELDELRATLEAERADVASLPAAEEPADDELVEDLRGEIASLREELSQARADAEAGEQARRRIVQLETELSDAHDDQGTSVLPPAEVTEQEEQPTGLFGSRGKPDADSRAPLREPSELAGLSDEELAQTFSSMREAARLADDRGDRDGAQSYRALARAAAEQAADRPDFGEVRVRGRKRNRLMKELAAARERALDRRPLSVAAADDEQETD